MTTFTDLKIYFHRLGDVCAWIRDWFEGQYWPLSSVGWYFGQLANWFYGAEWVCVGLDTWVSGIATDARNAYNTAVNAYNTAVNAWNAIPSQWTIQAWVASALGLPSLSWYYLIRGVRTDLASSLGLTDLSWDALSAKIRSSFEWTVDLSWLVTTPLPIINMSFVELAEAVQGKASQITLDGLAQQLDTAVTDFNEKLKDLMWRDKADELWTLLSPGLVDKLIKELDEKW